MGYVYGRTPAGGQALACDNCGGCGGVRKRTCPHKVTSDGQTLPYCQPPALCAECWKQDKGASHADCKAGAANMQAQDDAKQARLDAGDLIVTSAVSGPVSYHPDLPAGMTRVTFRAAGGGEGVVYLVPSDVYRDGYKADRLFLSDYLEAVPLRDPFDLDGFFGALDEELTRAA